VRSKLIILLCWLLIVQVSLSQQGTRVTADFNKGWKFYLGDDSLAVTKEYNDKAWRTLNLPHDWSIEGEFKESHPATTQGGALPGGIGWYRKSFVLTPAQANKHVTIEFDGVYRNSEVWINGHFLGRRPNGYISFQYDLTPWLLEAPAKNVIAVRVDNSQQPNSRWYTGSGIYRNVRLVAVSPVASVAHWGTFISTLITPFRAMARVDVQTTITSNQSAGKSIEVYTDIFDATGKFVTTTLPYEMRSSNAGNKPLKYQSSANIRNPRLWSVDSPYLYKAVTRVYSNGKKTDESTTLFGIREFHFDARNGFFLNNKPLKILGVCNHHDLGALGAAVNKRAIERQLEILKAMGCNAIRTAHNPPASELLELCDKMGFLVMVEAFDMWKKKKNKFDYFSDFNEWHKQDLQDMVLRDRNHPSVFMWSIGNEIREQFDSTGISITKELVAIVKSVDSTRPVIAALSEWNPEKNFLYKSGAFDIVGLNYHHEVYEDFQKYYPGKFFLGAENMSALATRGHYDFPSDTLMHWPARSPQKFVEKGNPDFTVSAYDQVSAYWGSTHEETWKIIKKHRFMSGLFVWTGFDYLGEPTPYPWPARSSYFGIIDLAGFPKDVYYMYQSEWTKKPVLHIFPHWNWNKDQLVDIWIYYNNADEVELFLNNRSLGVKKKENDALHLMWRVPFEPGVLKAVSRKNRKIVLSRQVVTAGKPAKIQLTADRKLIKADGKDISFITVRILDKDNNLVPDADHLVQFSIQGEGIIVGTDNGYQADLESLKSSRRKCWKGMALAIVQSTSKQGNITLKASSEGLAPAILGLKTGY
jgi:beta-galactosidase